MSHIKALSNQPAESGLPEKSESAAFQHLHKTLEEAFAAPDSAYVEMTAETIIARNRNR